MTYNLGYLENFTVKIPADPSKQARISQILSTVDKAIEETLVGKARLQPPGQSRWFRPPAPTPTAELTLDLAQSCHFGFEDRVRFDEFFDSLLQGGYPGRVS